MNMGERLKELRLQKGATQEEVGKVISVSKATIMKYEKGLVENLKRSSIEKLAKYFNVAPSYLMCMNEDEEKMPAIPTLSIPILGTVKAGYNWLAEENIIDYITIKENIPNVKEYYALRVTGDSMLPLLSEGDLVIVHDQDDVESGQTAIVLINGEEATVKKVIKTNEGIELHAMNPYYPTKKFTFQEMKTIPVKIIGRVKEAKIKGAFE